MYFNLFEGEKKRGRRRRRRMKEKKEKKTKKKKQGGRRTRRKRRRKKRRKFCSVVSVRLTNCFKHKGIGWIVIFIFIYYVRLFVVIQIHDNDFYSFYTHDTLQ